ncbi:MAG: hypothetical protein EP298_12165 [Gammaproteobacteria bacterium]|nr:MAG: hypothetical protein EP298_12165 [Gammaproteobacteria bacterium]UTW43049.1 hypothetical protein KFE69_02590 [bacterium SCSIO 12844]
MKEVRYFRTLFGIEFLAKGIKYIGFSLIKLSLIIQKLSKNNDSEFNYQIQLIKGTLYIQYNAYGQEHLELVKEFISSSKAYDLDKTELILLTHELVKIASKPTVRYHLEYDDFSGLFTLYDVTEDKKLPPIRAEEITSNYQIISQLSKDSFELLQFKLTNSNTNHYSDDLKKSTKPITLTLVETD